MGGSGLIVVVIVAAWALFLVPQWMHRRASAAAHLADRIPDQGSPDELADAEDDPVPGARPPRTRPRGRFGRRHLSRRPRADDGGERRFASWHLPTLPSLRRPTTRWAAPRSAAARRRRILSVLAAATLLTAMVVGLATLVGIAVPAWLVAVPGGLMVAYLVLLAIARPGARREAVHSMPLGETHPAAVEGDDVPAVVQTDLPAAAPASAVSAHEAGGAAVGTTESLVEAAGGSSWTPVPLPAPTYVTAPKARRAVRVIDLSNPGSWTTAPAAAEPARADLPEDADPARDDEKFVVEHRPAVGD